MEALGELAAQDPQVLELPGGLDPLRDDLEPEVVRELDDRLDDLERAAVMAHPAHERAEEEALLETYLIALGLQPDLFEAEAA